MCQNAYIMELETVPIIIIIMVFDWMDWILLPCKRIQSVKSSFMCIQIHRNTLLPHDP